MPAEWHPFRSGDRYAVVGIQAKLSSTIVRTCADDIGMALRRLDKLLIIAKIFDDFEQASNLHLKPAKSIMIPTVFKLSAWNLDMLRAWLRRNCPQWSEMIVRSSAKYLGFFLGPESGRFQWIAPFKKYADRIVSIHQLGLPFRLAATRHNYYALPVLAYVGQLALPPPNICRLELSAILKALSLADNSMTCKTAFSMDGLLGFSPSRPSVYLESCMLRSAFKTFEFHDY